MPKTNCCLRRRKTLLQGAYVYADLHLLPEGFPSPDGHSGNLKPISDEFFGSDSDFCMEDIYKEVFRLGEENISDIGHDILENFHTAANSFKDYDGEDRDTLQLFAFICLLSFDIYLKKEVIEQLIDAMEKRKTVELTKNRSAARMSCCFRSTGFRSCFFLILLPAFPPLLFLSDG